MKVLPGAYQLSNAEVPGVTELCNAFKAQYSSRLTEQGGGGKTPGIRAGKTPLGGRTPGGRTPAIGGMGGATPMYAVAGRTPMRPGMTPNPCKFISLTSPENKPRTAVDGGPPQRLPVNNAFGNSTPHNGYPPGGEVYPAPPQGPQGYRGPSPRGYGGPPASVGRPPLGMNTERA